MFFSVLLDFASNFNLIIAFKVVDGADVLRIMEKVRIGTTDYP